MRRHYGNTARCKGASKDDKIRVSGADGTYYYMERVNVAHQAILYIGTERGVGFGAVVTVSLIKSPCKWE
jgi:hypothetical protein